MPKKTKKQGKIELLAPAGDLDRLKTAVTFGADAVYCGLPQWSMRSGREITFTFATLKKGIEFAHSRGAKVYLTINIFPHEGQIEKLKKDLKKIKKLDIDAIILADLGVLSLVRTEMPKMPIHLSTQANTVNSEAAKQWKKLGVKRIVLARELSLREIKSIAKNLQPKTYNLAIEVFGHGAMCIAYSGRCLLSKYFVGREANLGECAQSCRWKYKVYIQEEFRPDNMQEVQEDKNGTYILSSQDLMTLDIIPKMIDAGVDSLKIEGRAKSPYYLATVVRAYRQMIDCIYGDTERRVSRHDASCLYEDLHSELDKLVHRGYSHGFLLGSDSYEQNYESAAIKPNVRFVGMILDEDTVRRDFGLAIRNQFASSGFVAVEVKNKFAVGETVEMVTPGKIYRVKIKEIDNGYGEKLEQILDPQSIVYVKFSKEMPDLVPYSVMRKKTKQ